MENTDVDFATYLLLHKGGGTIIEIKQIIEKIKKHICKT